MLKKLPDITSPGINTTSSLQSSPIKYRLHFLLLVLFNSGLVISRHICNVIHEICLAFLVLVFLVLCFCSSASFAQEQSVPRFAIVKSNQVNARSGPGTTYPIEWVFVSKGEPIKIIAEFEQWRKVEDVEGKGGWIHSSVLSPKRSVVIIGNNVQKLLAQDDPKSRIIAKIEPGLRCVLDKCRKHWCKIKCDGYKGWIEAPSIWGILKSEEESL